MPIDQTKSAIAGVRRNLFFILVAITTLGFLGLIGPFLLTVLWAVVLALIFIPVFYWVLRKIGPRRRGLASGITTVGILLFVIIPFALLGVALVNQGIELYGAIQSGEVDTQVVIDYVDRSLPRVAKSLEQFGITTADLREKTQEVVTTASQFIATRALALGSNVLALFVQFTLMLYLLYFFLKDGRQIVRKIVATIPMGNVRERQLFTRFALVSKATLKGTLIVAFVQGLIGGILFAVLGIPAPLLWGAAMVLLALLPVGGSAIIWVPAAIVLFAQGFIVKAIIIVVVGTLIIGLVDNLLRPLLVGRDTQMPDYLVLISTLGGITFFGLSGFVVGPVVAALFITVWEMMGSDYGGNRG